MADEPLSYYRLPLILLSVIALLCVATAINPTAGRINWLLEVLPGLAGILILILLHRRFPMSHMVYCCVFCHMLILIYGGYYTYAETPLGNRAKDVFGFSRNHYDRVGHIALGVFPRLHHPGSTASSNAAKKRRMAVFHHYQHRSGGGRLLGDS